MKGISLLGMGLWVAISTILATFSPGPPQADIMGIVGFVALMANVISVPVLLRYRHGDANIRSVWLCSRNDAIRNGAVMLAALGVWGSPTGWPDLIVAGAMAALFMASAVSILTQSFLELRTSKVRGLI